MNSIVGEYNSILDEWAAARDAAGDPGKEEVDKCFTQLSDAREALCALRGGSKRSKKQRRTRKHRR